MKKILISFLIVLMLVGCASSSEDAGKSGNSGKGGGTLTVAYPAQPPTLDPHVTVAVPTTDIGRNIFETLLAFNERNEASPLLAESFESSKDLRSITFKLREGVKFHNGKEMTADDVVASMERWRQLNGKANTYFSKSEFVKEDDYTVVLKMDKPFTIAKYILATNINFPAIMPKEVIENAPKAGVKEYIGTGPFKLEEWKKDQFIKLVKNRDYQSPRKEPDGLVGKKDPMVDKLVFRMVPDASTRTTGLQTGEYDIALQIPYDNVPTIESDGNLEAIVHPEGFSTVIFNKRNGLFSNEKARQALNLAVDKKEVMLAAYTDEKFFSQEHGLLSKEYVSWYSQQGKEKYDAYDPEAAKKLLKEAGYDGEELKILTTREYESHYQTAVVIQDNLKKIGVKTDLQIYDWATLMEVREDDNFYDLLTMGNIPVTDPTQINFLDSRINYTGWSNSPEIDQLLDQLMVAPSDEEAKEIFGELQNEYWNYLPAVKFGNYDRVAATRTNVENFEWFQGPVFWNTTKSD
ncbi:peptide ABC transporter substrate-binding protein [Siminovitchia terrae]|uniref:ABC transporter substrate-binding protein n=1 Tax=Siminovitchia terrae TaxID=1914933 RepID=A0A429X204_SIMTE|nr:ABC transporter substrate-binding protein [Siminovitchia terrae]RST57496.1 ABC transporter substrate-binding protein [Siminovitchia terrae]GIN95575.1 peptide ABC transporter substrate-binding protein [Siminovitchia terrae]